MSHPSELPISQALFKLVSGEDYYPYELDGKRYAACRDDMEKMVAMELANLPVDSIALPENSPLLSNERTHLTQTADYSRRLTEFFPVYFVAAMYELQSLFARMDIKGYVIGGIIRDMFLYHHKRLQIQDVDITMEGDALGVAEFLMQNSKNFDVSEEFPEFGTAKAQYKDCLSFDLASTRREVYPHCGALPVVVKRGVPLVEDIIRRDFTVNALAFSIHSLGQVLDYSGGIQDVEDGIVRVLHAVSFYEDPSRILRALKFCARFDFYLSPETHRLMNQFFRYPPSEYKGGGDRIKQELKGFLSVEESDSKRRMLAFFINEGCYHLMNMELNWKASPELAETLVRVSEKMGDVRERLTAFVTGDFAFDIYLCFVCRDMPEEDFQQLAFRMGLTKNERDGIEKYRRSYTGGHARFKGLHEFSSPVEIYDLFYGLPVVSVVASLIELGFDNSQLYKSGLEAFLKYKRKWEKLSLELNGNDLIELGVPEGKTVGKLLDQMLHAKLAGRVSDRMSEINYIKYQLQGEAQSGPEPPNESAESTAG